MFVNAVTLLLEQAIVAAKIMSNRPVTAPASQQRPAASRFRVRWWRRRRCRVRASTAVGHWSAPFRDRASALSEPPTLNFGRSENGNRETDEGSGVLWRHRQGRPLLMARIEVAMKDECRAHGTQRDRAKASPPPANGLRKAPWRADRPGRPHCIETRSQILRGKPLT